MFGLGKKYTYIAKINEMHCIHCAAHVEEAIAKIDGVKSVKVDLDDKSATIVSKKELTEESVKSAVEGIGKVFVSLSAK